MKKTVMILRERLFSIIRRLGEEPERYARKPGRDFTRKRTLTPAVLIHLILAMGEKSVWKGLLGYFRRRIDTPSASAFVQQRQKLLPSALEDLFHRFSDRLRPQKTVSYTHLDVYKRQVCQMMLLQILERGGHLF